MAISVKVLEKGAGTKTRTATASLGGLITSESDGYAFTNATGSLTTTSNHYWTVTGNAGTIASMYYDTAVACTSGHQIYIRAKMRAQAAGVNNMALVVNGTTAGSSTAVTQSSPTQYSYYEMSGIVTLNAGFTGNIRLRFQCYEADGVTGVAFRVFDWQAINLTAQFGAGSEPTAEELDAFYEWRTVATYGNKNWYSADGDLSYRASNVTSHGLEFNDMIYFDPAGTASASPYHSWCLVYPLNDDWIITNATFIIGDEELDLAYWTKVDYTSRMLAQTLSLNIRNDIDGGGTLAFLGNSTWQPQLGMQLSFYDDTECLFCGFISNINTVELNDTNWRCECVVSSLLNYTRWSIFNVTDSGSQGFSTGDSVDYAFAYGVNLYTPFWYGDFYVGNASTSFDYTKHLSHYDLINSLCKSAGLVLTVSPDRQVSARSQTSTASAAPRNITDAVSPTVWGMSYSESIDDYGNEIVVDGGYASDGTQARGYYLGTSALSTDIIACRSDKSVQISDKTVVNDTDATSAAQTYYKRFGKVVPGEFKFTTTDLDYRPDQKLTVQIAKLGMTAAKTMHIDSVTIYDVDGVNVLSTVVASNRDSTDFANAPNYGSDAYLSNVNTKLTQTTTDVSQKAGTFTPALQGETAEGTWEWYLQIGNYLRIGNMCYVAIVLQPSSITDSPTGNLQLTGLPFTVSTVVGQFLDVLSTGVNWGTNMTDIKVWLGTSGETGLFYGSGNNIAYDEVPVGNVSANDNIKISGWYQCI